MFARRGDFLIAALIVALLAPGARAAAPAPTREPGAQVGFWAGETGKTTAYTPAVWQVLAGGHAVLYMNLVYGTDYGPTSPGQQLSTVNLGLIRQANRLGITVNAWLTFSAAEGTFANQENAGVVAQAVPALWAWIRANHLTIHETVLDLEQATGYQPVADALAGHLGTLEQTLHANIDPAAQCQAMDTYRDTVSWAHEHGMRLTATPVPFSMDDVVLDHNMGLSNALDIPGYVPGMYDEVYLQAYRAEFGFDLGSAYVVRYYRLMQHYFGAVGQVSLGNVGDPPYNSAAPLISDIRMLAGLGATSIPIFDFDSTVADFGIAGLKRVIAAGREPLTGGALAAAEQSSPASSGQGDGAVQLFATLNEAANLATLSVTASEGSPRQPNSWPNGCGPMRPAPLR